MKRSGHEPGAGNKFGAAKQASQGQRVDIGQVRALAEILGVMDLSEIEIEEGGVRIRVTRHATAKSTQVVLPVEPAPSPLPHPSGPAAAEPSVPLAEHPGVVKSPMVGTVYRRPSPEAKAFVEVGAEVKAGERVLLVEAMKTFNDIVAHRSGTVAEILVEDGQPVEYGEPLLIIE
ncbi:MAG: acetyl-CoA carboxylase biotin carboxyl carrier protein [Methylobacteriaceae bacterium]|nr:acetyl-CoA carboxylase biotin carboxyl carrier protein [Methylobacteriaceae bacterium]MBV9221809.1 acetyl-CoA carboxylase biotin carboxyl carrier protein [Methylobacteriaceae bacterium]MBV9244840.1 acetyl-CoA carboxylase biotin carboxyl carrier protein [Methylobacteriaceae bacterium]